MKKLLNTIIFSRDVRKNLLLLDALLDVAVTFEEVCNVNRDTMRLLTEIRKQMNNRPSLIARIELIEVHRQLRNIRKTIATKTAKILNSQLKAA